MGSAASPSITSGLSLVVVSPSCRRSSAGGVEGGVGVEASGAGFDGDGVSSGCVVGGVCVRVGPPGMQRRDSTSTSRVTCSIFFSTAVRKESVHFSAVEEVTAKDQTKLLSCSSRESVEFDWM